jgi:hypothetical protein
MQPSIYTIDHFLSTDDCLFYIELAERIGFEPATIETEKGPRLLKAVRNNYRILHNDPELAASFWKKISASAPARYGNSSAIGLNELFRFYKYEPGQQFRWHIDQPFIRSEIEASYYTLLVYLNDDYLGGETSFEKTTIKPRIGTALIFLHSLPHAGNEVLAGTKYVIRTDIMYRLDETT